MDSILGIKDNDPFSAGNNGIIPYKNVEILSRYLASTTNSGHDHGIRQDSDPNLLGSRTLITITEKSAEGKKKSAVNFPPFSPKSPKPDSPVSTRREFSTNSLKGNLFKKFLKPTLSKLSTFSAEDHSKCKGIGSDVRYINVLATSSNRKQTIRNSKEEKTSKFNGKKALSSRASAAASLKRPIVSLAPIRVAKKYTSTRTDKFKNLKVVAKADKISQNHIPSDQMSTTSRGKFSHIPNGKGIVKAKNSTARKVNFRRENVIGNQPVISPSRRLKSKQRSLSEKIENNYKNGKIRVDDSVTNAVNSEQEKVVSKSQDGDEDNKGQQNLLNNMIEKSANKLPETKTSKVKVLVGAFETLISLQDTKPAEKL